MLAVTFPGQGSQRPGMGRPWVGHPSWSVVERASAAAELDVARLLVDAGEADLVETANAQLAVFVLGLVVLDALRACGVRVDLCAGHSLGEYSALVAGGVLDADDGVHLVTRRGEAMAEAAAGRPGAMAAVLGADLDTVHDACAAAGGEVWVANDNAPGQVVIAGDPDAVVRAGQRARTDGARKVTPLRVAGAFHTPFMAAARARLDEALACTRFAPGDVPIAANVDARVHHSTGDWPALLGAQLTSPVRWRESLGALAAAGATTVVELGATTLTPLARRTIGEQTLVSVNAPEDLEHLAKQRATGVGS